MRIIIKICHMGNFLFREISAVTESQRGAECAIRQKGKKTAHGLRYDCPDGRLSSIILHVVYPLIRQSYDRYKVIYTRCCGGSQVEIKGLTKNAKGSNSYGLTEMSHAGYNEIILLSGETGGNCGC